MAHMHIDFRKIEGLNHDEMYSKINEAAGGSCLSFSDEGVSTSETYDLGNVSLSVVVGRSIHNPGSVGLANGVFTGNDKAFMLRIGNEFGIEKYLKECGK